MHWVGIGWWFIWVIERGKCLYSTMFAQYARSWAWSPAPHTTKEGSWPVIPALWRWKGVISEVKGHSQLEDSLGNMRSLVKHNSIFCFALIGLFKSRSHYVAWAGPKLMILQSPSRMLEIQECAPVPDKFQHDQWILKPICVWIMTPFLSLLHLQRVV